MPVIAPRQYETVEEGMYVAMLVDVTDPERVVGRAARVTAHPPVSPVDDPVPRLVLRALPRDQPPRRHVRPVGGDHRPVRHLAPVDAGRVLVRPAREPLPPGIILMPKVVQPQLPEKLHTLKVKVPNL